MRQNAQAFTLRADNLDFASRLLDDAGLFFGDDKSGHDLDLRADYAGCGGDYLIVPPPNAIA
jgi:hypothetical protein